MGPLPTGGVCSEAKRMGWVSMDWARRIYGCHNLKARQGRTPVSAQAKRLQRNRIPNRHLFCSKILAQTRTMLNFARKSFRGHTPSTLNWFSISTIPDDDNIKADTARLQVVTLQGQIYGHGLHANLPSTSQTALLSKDNGNLSQVVVLHTSVAMVILTLHKILFHQHKCPELSEHRLSSRNHPGNLIINSHIHLVASTHRACIKPRHCGVVQDR